MWVQKYGSIGQNKNKCARGRPIYKTAFDNIELFLQRMHEPENENNPFFFLNFLTEYTHGTTLIRQSYVYDKKHQKSQSDQNFEFVFTNRFEWH